MKTLHHFSFILFITVSVQFSFAQESGAEDEIKISKWEYYLTTGAGISSEINNDSEWLVPQAAASFGTGFSRKIGEHISLSSGVGIDFYSFKSKPYYYSYTTYSHYHLPNGGIQVNAHHHKEDFLREAKRRSVYFSVPINFEYRGTGTWAPYFNVGAVFSFNIFDQVNQTKTETGEAVYNYTYDDNENLAGNFAVSALFSSVGAGVRYKKGKISYRFGLTSNIGLTPFEGNYYSKWRLPHSFKFEVGVRREISGGRYSEFKKQSVDDKRSERINFFYVELPKFIHFEGASMLFPVNFERSFVINNVQRVNARFGVALENYKGSYAPNGLRLSYFQFGAGWIYGQVHNLELSVGIGRYFGPSGPDIAIIPSIGYRFEPKGKFFGRIALAPDFWANEGLNYFHAFVPTVSLGVHF